ncbi:prenyltransferase/squalene oxidase repeat-containing protein [Rhodopirellula halodulae]|uniref:prenyltransferase/squalene oxidase repeat-containing protein n=1 Tax=Rhodopirellula halodulae TaxID=2894198 RepID=UPI001E55059D|nr:prenyltransferase/squalene oxidase repeat-containing protein [Rhodopirellula sp. JC737]MCC9656956.1 terpene cyclase/mutase family protein [Rhodopirellula sp. JC737]
MNLRCKSRCVATLAFAFAFCLSEASAQLPTAQLGDVVPRDVREMYEKGLDFLAKSQSESGEWGDGSYTGPGVTGMAVMTFLASGEDPNYGIYSGNIRRGLRSIVNSQDPNSGILGGMTGHASMYNHGFAMLALAEAYGVVNERLLNSGSSTMKRSLGEALELAVRGAVTSQKKNSYGGWRYGADARDADTSVSGAVMVGLLAARNAGIKVPDEAIDRGVAYFKSMTSDSGQVAYAGLGGFSHSTPRISIGCLVYAVSRRKDMPEFKATLTALTNQMDVSGGVYQSYGNYYQAQALFQGDVEVWEKWNGQLIRQMKNSQNEDGSFSGNYGTTVETSLSLLAMALNFRFLPIYER